MNKPNIDVVVSGAKQAECTYKNVVLKGNHSFASQVKEPNTKYIIKWDFDLGEVEDRILNFTSANISSVNTPEKIELDAAIASGNEARIERARTAYATIDNQDYYYWKPVQMQAGYALHLSGRAIRLNAEKTNIIPTDNDIIFAVEDTVIYVGCLAGSYSYRYDRFITIPDGCILEFDGGTVGNGFLVGNILNDTVYSSWFSDDYSLISSINNLTGYKDIKLEQKEYSLPHSISIKSSCTIEGNNGIIKRSDAGAKKSLCFIDASNLDYLHVNNLIFDGSDSNTDYTPAETTFVSKGIFLTNIADIKFKNVKIQNVQIKTLSIIDYSDYDAFFYAEYYNNITLKNVDFINVRCASELTWFAPLGRIDIPSTDEEWEEIAGQGVYPYCRNLVEITDCSFQGHYFSPICCYGRLRFNGNHVLYSSGSVLNMFCSDSEVKNNIIEGTTKSYFIDLTEQSQEEKVFHKAKNIVVSGNTILNSNANFILASCVDGLTIENNYFYGNPKWAETDYIRTHPDRKLLARLLEISGAKNVCITDNVFDGFVRFMSLDINKTISNMTISNNRIDCFIEDTSSPIFTFFNADAISITNNSFSTRQARKRIVVYFYPYVKENSEDTNCYTINSFEFSNNICNDQQVIVDTITYWKKSTLIDEDGNEDPDYKKKVLCNPSIFNGVVFNNNTGGYISGGPTGSNIICKTTDNSIYFEQKSFIIMNARNLSDFRRYTLQQIKDFGGNFAQNVILSDGVTVGGFALYHVYESDAEVITVDKPSIVGVKNRGVYFVTKSGTFDVSELAVKADTVQYACYNVPDRLTGNNIPILVIATHSNARYTVSVIPFNQIGGTTRPVDNLYIGRQFFDSSISPARPIWWDGTQWVNVDGTPVS